MEENRKINVVQIDEIRWFNVGAWYATSLSRGLAELDHRVLFVAKGDMPPARAAREAGIDLRNDFTFSGIRMISESGKLAKIIRDFKADVVCAHRAWGMNLALAARAILPAPGPVIVRARVDARPVKAGIGSRFIYRRMADGVVVPDSVSAARHIEALGVSQERIKIIPGGVDTELFKPDSSARALREEWGAPKSGPMIGLVGRLDHVKGHAYFLEAAALIVKDFPNAYFAIIGEEVNVKLADLKRQTLDLGVGDKIIFVGRRDDVHRCVAALDIGVVASAGSEALSRVALEYMACGLPVVTTDVGGIPDILEDGAVGFVVPHSNPAAMADAIEKILNKPELAKQMGEEGRRRAENVYSRKAMAHKNAIFYLELIERRLARAKV